MCIRDRLGEGDSVRCEGPTEFEVGQARPWARTAPAALASRPAPASGRVDAVAWRTVSDFVDEMLRDWPGGDDCRMGFGLNGATVTKGQFRAVQAALASLPPAATPVSEAGGEADWNRIARRMQRAGAPGTEEELEAALRAALAKPASSPACGDVATGPRAEIAHDGFSGDIIGRYVTVSYTHLRPRAGAAGRGGEAVKTIRLGNEK